MNAVPGDFVVRGEASAQPFVRYSMPNQPVEATSTQRTVSRLQARGCRIADGGRASPCRSACCAFSWPSDGFTSSVYGSSRPGQGREESNGDGWAMACPRSSIDVVGRWEFGTGMVTPNPYQARVVNREKA